jgi:hypothetical protein
MKVEVRDHLEGKLLGYVPDHGNEIRCRYVKGPVEIASTIATIDEFNDGFGPRRAYRAGNFDLDFLRKIPGWEDAPALPGEPKPEQDT